VKECTLQEAILECSKNGGGIYYSKNFPEQKFSLDGMGQPIHYTTEMPAMFYDERYTERWIYEQPKRSAFQAWVGNQAHIDEKYINRKRLSKELRKEGWNAAIDAAIDAAMKKISNDSDSGESIYLIKEIKELKED
jgi:hypothetical protein